MGGNPIATYADCEIERRRLLALGQKIQVRLVKNPFMGNDGILSAARGSDGNGDWPGDKTNADQYMLQVKLPPGGPQMGSGSRNSHNSQVYGSAHMLCIAGGTPWDIYTATQANRGVGKTDTWIFRSTSGGMSGYEQRNGLGVNGPGSTLPKHNLARLQGTRPNSWIMVHVDSSGGHAFEGGGIQESAGKIT